MSVARVPVLALLFGCHDTPLGPDAGIPDDGVPGDAPTTETDTGSEVAPERPLAGGIEIAKVSLWQGVESVLVEDGVEPNTVEMPLIIGRPALVRVYLRPLPSWNPRKVTAVMNVVSQDGDQVMEVTQRVTAESVDGDLESTFNFELPAEMVKRTTHFELEIVEETADGPGGGKPKDAAWASADTGGLDPQLTDELQIVLIPVRYNADGSGRLPDTSASQVELITELTMVMYPATNVVVRVDPPLDWPRRISPFSSGDWTDVLDELIDMRSRANEPNNTYYYGMFNPEPTLNQFCSSGCILGLSYLAFSAEPFFRASVGVGYPGPIASETMVHEVGHAHGREHAPCGLYGQPADRNYPYSGARIGSWGNDVVSGELFNPANTVDMMSYCQNIWVSDYTFFALYERMQQVAGQFRGPPIARTAVKLGEDGTSTMRTPVSLASTAGAPRVNVELRDASGLATGQSTAAFYPYDHVAGGLVVLDSELPAGWTATVVP
jgi:hypothetical protein